MESFRVGPNIDFWLSGSRSDSRPEWACCLGEGVRRQKSKEEMGSIESSPEEKFKTAEIKFIFI